jgi:hypothetical protein
MAEPLGTEPKLAAPPEGGGAQEEQITGLRGLKDRVKQAIGADPS